MIGTGGAGATDRAKRHLIISDQTASLKGHALLQRRFIPP